MGDVTRGGGRVAPASISALVGQARRASRAPYGARMRRVVLRLDAETLARVDTLRKRWPEASRAALLRAFCLFGLHAAEWAPLVREGAP